jgi:hypothetical protein
MILCMIIYYVKLYFRFQCGLYCFFTYGFFWSINCLLQFFETELANVRFNGGLLRKHYSAFSLFKANWKFYERPGRFCIAVVIRVIIKYLLNCSTYSQCKKVSGSREQLIIDCLYCVNKQLTQLSIYRLMQHVSRFKRTSSG